MESRKPFRCHYYARNTYISVEEVSGFGVAVTGPDTLLDLNVLSGSAYIDIPMVLAALQSILTEVSPDMNSFWIGLHGAQFIETVGHHTNLEGWSRRLLKELEDEEVGWYMREHKSIEVSQCNHLFHAGEISDSSYTRQYTHYFLFERFGIVDI
jgi:hypothetical protein